jgi:hypothetical protein
MQETENIVEPQYEAPTIESVVTEEDMQREVAYAAVVGPSSPGLDGIAGRSSP